VELFGRGFSEAGLLAACGEQRSSGPESAPRQPGARSAKPLDPGLRPSAWRLAGGRGENRSSSCTEKFRRLLSLLPPGGREGFSFGPSRDVVFVLDRSGSMQGVKMASAARGLRPCLAAHAWAHAIVFRRPGVRRGGRVDAGADFLQADEGRCRTRRAVAFARDLAFAGRDGAGTLAMGRRRSERIRGTGASRPARGGPCRGPAHGPARWATNPVVLKALAARGWGRRALFHGWASIYGPMNGGFLRRARCASGGGNTSTLVEPGSRWREALQGGRARDPGQARWWTDLRPSRAGCPGTRHRRGLPEPVSPDAPIRCVSSGFQRRAA